MNLFLYLWICVCTYEYVSVPMNMYLYLWVCVCTYEYVSVPMSVCLYLWICVCTMYITVNMCLYYICILYTYSCILEWRYYHWKIVIKGNIHEYDSPNMYMCIHIMYVIMLILPLVSGNIHEYVSVPMNMCLYLWICVCNYEYVSVPMNMCLYLWICVCTDEYVSVHVLCMLPFCTMYIDMNMCLYYICIYVYLCISPFLWPFSVYHDFLTILCILPVFSMSITILLRMVIDMNMCLYL